jgi:hypothetical protein
MKILWQVSSKHGSRSLTVQMALQLHHPPDLKSRHQADRYRHPKALHDDRNFVASQQCLACGRSPADAHHLRFAQPPALGRKVSDEFTVPVCRVHHRDAAPAWRRASGKRRRSIRCRSRAGSGSTRDATAPRLPLIEMRGWGLYQRQIVRTSTRLPRFRITAEIGESSFHRYRSNHQPVTPFRQFEANPRNALRSTGPTTEDGKRRSRQNAVRHGLSAETVVEIVDQAIRRSGCEIRHRQFYGTRIPPFKICRGSDRQRLAADRLSHFVSGAAISQLCPRPCGWLPAARQSRQWGIRTARTIRVNTRASSYANSISVKSAGMS